MILEKVGISKSSVGNIINKYKKPTNITKASKCGRFQEIFQEIEFLSAIWAAFERFFSGDIFSESNSKKLKSDSSISKFYCEKEIIFI